ncbi:MAG: ATP-grasp domain-containing protein [Pseudomonadota bacterium]
MTRHRILVLGVSSNVTIGILKALRAQSDLDLHIVGACVSHRAAGFTFCDDWLICPYANDPGFSAWLTETAEAYQADAILSGVEAVLLKFAELQAALAPRAVLVHSLRAARTFTDKWLTCQWFASHGLAHPETLWIDGTVGFEELAETLGLPFIVKPAIGGGSNGLRRIGTREEYDALPEAAGLIAQQIVGTADEEYTCAVYQSPNGYRRVLIQRRYLKGGSTSYAELVADSTIRAYCDAIADAIGEPGAFNIQLRISDDGVPVCFEVNLRLSGTTHMRHQFGFRDCVAWLIEAMGGHPRPELFQPTGMVVGLRMENEVFLDEAGKERLLSLAAPDHGR